MKNLDYIENYMELASGIVEQAVKDYVQNGWWLKNHPVPKDNHGTYFCDYHKAEVEFHDAKKFLENPVGFIQEIFNADDCVIQSIIEEAEKATNVGPTMWVEKIVTKKKKNGEIVEEKKVVEVKTTKVTLYSRIKPIVDNFRTKLGLDHIEKLD